MAKSSTSFEPGKGGSGRGVSFKTKLLKAVVKSSLLDLPENATKEQAEEAYLSHLAERAFAKDGDSILLRETLNKMYSSIKATLPTVEFDYDVTLSPTDQANQIISAASSGHIPPDVAGIFLGAIKDASVIELNTDIKERLEKLEAMINDS